MPGEHAVFTPLRDPIVNSDSVGTQSKALCADHVNNLSYNVRRVRLYNTHSVGTLGLYLADRGEDPTSGVFASAIQIPPGQIWSSIISSEHRLLVIGNIAGVTYNYMVDDI